MNEDGPVLAEGIAEYLSTVRGPGGVPLEKARLLADRDAWKIAYPRPEGMAVTNSFVVREGDEVAVRIYRPAGEGEQAAILYCHGGGFTIGGVESYDSFATVISVQYARLPEATPQGVVTQCHDVLRWVVRMATILQIDRSRIAVAGDSAGAFIAVQLALLARDHGPALAGQLLCYGVFDLDPDRAAYAQARDPVLTLGLIKTVITAYRAAEARDAEPFVVPVHADLAGLPPAILLEAEYDPVTQEGEEYAARLRAAGVPVVLRIAPAMPHGFLRAVRFSEPARAEMRWLGEQFRTLIKG
jgi:acetyl esterase